MIHNTNTLNIDGNVLKNEELAKIFSFSKDDKFSQWVLRPLAVLITIGMGIAMFFASAFLIVLSLAMLPMVALSFWALKTKLERDLAKANPVVDTQTTDSAMSGDDTQTAS